MSTTFQTLYKQLNKEQKAAVDTIDGPVMIIAGPGTGKTQVLTLRIANILKKTDIDPQNILALTFTESGVKAMRERLVSIIGETGYYAHIYTFHSFCNDIIKEFPEKFIMSEEYDALSDLERIQIFREIIDGNDFKLIKPLGSKYFYIPTLVSKIQDLKREDISPQEFEKIIREEEEELEEIDKINPKTKKPYGKYLSFKKGINKHKDLLKVYKEYQKKLQEIGRYDFEDMISLVLSRLQTDEDFRLTLQERYHYILVDEYQDTNTAQNHLVKTLADYWDNPNVFVVGDDEQSIYRFQGASLENILYFRNLYPDCNIVTLKSSYRNPQVILDGSRSIIENNKVQITSVINEVIKDLQSESKLKGHPIHIYKFNHGDIENYFLAKEIKNLINKKVKPSEIAIFVRNNFDFKDIIPFLNNFNIPYFIEGGDNILEDGDINRLLNLLKLIDDPYNDTLLFAVLNYNFLGIKSLDILKSANFASKKRMGLFELLTDEDLQKELKLKEADKLFAFISNILKWKKNDANLPFVNFFETVLNESGYIEWILEDRNNTSRLLKLNNLYNEIKKLNYSSTTLNLKELIENIQLLKENNIKIKENEFRTEKQGVRIMTAHKAKGLEFDYVFITKAVNKKWGNPSIRELIKLPAQILKHSKSAPTDTNEDERRLFYVAITRAKKKVSITLSEKYSLGVRDRLTMPTIFINEISSEYKKEEKTDEIEVEFAKNISSIIASPPQSSKITIDEKEFIDKILEDFKLSATALNTYLECPYKFKLNNLFRVPRAKTPTLCFGTAVHEALRFFFDKFKKTKVLPKLELLKKEFEKALKKEILSQEDFDHLLKEGLETLEEYYNKHSKDFAIPLYLEYSFGFKKVYLGDIALTGIIDKIEILDSNKKNVKVVDYKTSAPKSHNAIMGKTQNSDGNLYRQLLFYKLLSLLDHNFNLNVTEAELLFLKRGQIKSEQFGYKNEEIEDFKIEIRKTINNIRTHKFLRTKDLTPCSYCDFRDHCWPEGIQS